jgi:hypothetical protein
MVDPVWIAASAAIVSAVAAFTSAGAAVWSARNGNRTLRRAELDSQARTRPSVVAELRNEPHARATQLLVIKNYGPTVARDIVVTFDPLLPDPPSEIASQSTTPFLKSRYAEPIPVLAPGTELDNIYFSGKNAGGSGWANFEPLPDKVTVTISYLAPDGRRYVDEYRLDVGIIRNKTYVSGGTLHPVTQRKEHLDTLKKIQGSLGKIEKVLEQLARDQRRDRQSDRHNDEQAH